MKKFPFLHKENGLSSYPSQIINDKLYLGNKTHATTKQILMDLSINYIINMTPSFENQLFDKDEDLQIKYLQIPIYDDESAEIEKYFEKGIEFINNALSDTKKIVCRCQSGVSRSSTMIIAYLMKMKKMNFIDAYKYTLERREIIEPNQGFVKKLKQYHEIL